MVYYDDEGAAGRHITVSQTATGCILRSTGLASELQTGTPINGNSKDPWTTGFFDSNSEAFLVDSPPDELLDFVPLESQPEPKDRRIVRMPFAFEYSHIDKGFLTRPTCHSKSGKCAIVLCISMSYFVMMVELVNPRARSVETATAFTSARNVSAVVFIVGRASFNNTYLILCIGLRCVLLRVCQGIDLIYPTAMERFYLRADILT